MRQVLQNLGTGETFLSEVPCPKRDNGFILVETTSSVVSLGTEKMLLDFGKANLLEKARQQPDKVKEVIQKIRTDGLVTTIDAVQSKLDSPLPLGYCNVGRVIETEPCSGFQIGDRVASNGSHAEIVSVPKNLCAKVPDGVSDESACFTVVSAIGLQGIRLLSPNLGERIVVIGLGLIGLLTVQMLRAHGCQVLGIDLSKEKLELAKRFGADVVDLSVGQNPIKGASSWSNGIGVDGVIITASAKTDEVIHQAACMCRKRGKIVLVGVIGLKLKRDDFYKKELTFQVSCSYGPGRYDDNYERDGIDYPIAYVRWTEQRNFEAVLRLMKEGKINVEPLITHRFPFHNAIQAYNVVAKGNALGIILNYDASVDDKNSKRETLVSVNKVRLLSNDIPRIAFLGAGNFTKRMLLPALIRHEVILKTITSNNGVSGTYTAKKFGFQNSCSDIVQVINDPDIDGIFITTPHNTHAELVLQCLNSKKAVFVEKPLALRIDEVNTIEKFLQEENSSVLMVGFNRRFSPHTQWLKGHIENVKVPIVVIITINAGSIPEEHWVQNPRIGGGRIIGEACHFIDLARYLIGKKITESQIRYLGGQDGRLRDSANIQLSFEDGSLATLHYLSNGNKKFPKERIEVFASGKVFVIDNFRKSFCAGIKEVFRTYKQDKGHYSEVKSFLNSLRTGESPIPSDEIIEVSRLSITLSQSQ